MNAADCFSFEDRMIPFHRGESFASALERAGIRDYGPDGVGGSFGQFCGIGMCQRCLIRLENRLVEACLEPAVAGSRLECAYSSPAGAPSGDD